MDALVLPHNLDAERALLGAMLQSADARAVGSEVRPDDFYAAANKHIFLAIAALMKENQPVDLVVVTDWLRSAGLLEEAGGAAYVTDLVGGEPVPSNAAAYARMVMRDGLKRELAGAFADLQRGALNGHDLGPLLDLADRATAAVRDRLNGPASGTTLAFAAASAKDLCALPDDPAAELLGPVLVRGARTLVGAHTGHGKTTFGLQALKAALTGGALLDWKGTGVRCVLYVDAEQGQRTIQRRLREAGLDSSDQLRVVRVPDGLSLDKRPEEVAALEAAIVFEKPDALFIEPLYKLHSGDSNSEREAVDLMKVLDRWRERYRFALLMATHTRKPPPVGARFTMHEFFGSSAYLRGAEVILGLEFVRPGFSRLHFFKDRDGDLPVGTRWPLLFSREGGFVRDPAGDRRPTAAEKVAAVIAADPEITTDALSKVTGLAPRTVRDARKKLIEAANSRALFEGDEGGAA